MNRELRRVDLDPDPFRQFSRWYEEARAADPDAADAVALATAARDGRPSVRMVLFKGLHDSGFVFYTNYESRKARELLANPHAALAFYWPTHRRQVRVTGAASRVSAEDSDRYYAGRPREAQVAAWASRQSEVIPDRAWLEKRYAGLDAEFDGREVPRPAWWGGIRLEPDAFEFWCNRPDRLHDRFRYARGPDGGWAIDRLSP
jgi:pyridoxamine 5'-phosphate oxidase